MADKGHSDPDFLGGYTHYDEKGHKTGKSEPGFFDDYTHYDAGGNRTGHSDPDLFGGYTHYDSRGHKTGYSEPDLFGGYTHYDKNGKKLGSSDPDLFGGYSNQSGSDGCYIATCVYGSYDCPEVRTLRRFRDRVLKRSPAGRAFVRAYYAVSPGLVARHGKSAAFRKVWRRLLDGFVSRLRAKGYPDGAYRDEDR